MRVQQITSLIFLGLVAISSCQPVDNNNEARGLVQGRTPKKNSAPPAQAKPDKQPSKGDKTAKVGKGDNTTKAPVADKTAKSGKGDKTTKAPATEKTAKPGKGDKTTKAPATEKTSEPSKTGKPAADKTGKTETPTETGKTEAPSCKKPTMFHRVPKPKAKAQPKTAKRAASQGGQCKKKRSNDFDARSSNIDYTNTFSNINKRAITTFEMNGDAKSAKLSANGDQLHTHSLGGCSVVAIYSKNFAVAVHVSQGTLGQNDQAATAKEAMDKLMSEYRLKADRTQPVKALIFSADLGDDNLATDEFFSALEKASMKDVIYFHQYDHNQYCNLPNPLTDAVLDITYAGNGLWPQVTSAGQCLDMENKMEEE